MNSLMKLPVLILALTLMATQWAVAEEGNISLQSIVQKEVITTNDKGKKEVSLESAALVKPGEVVRYTNIYKNISDTGVDNIVLNNPIPEHTVYVELSGFGENTQITFSADGAATYAPLAELTVTEKNGTERRAVATDITHIRWTRTISLPPNGEGQVGFSARLK
jgi:uncharacterized repeat protein (TIGR01451 family)